MTNVADSRLPMNWTGVFRMNSDTALESHRSYHLTGAILPRSNRDDTIFLVVSSSVVALSDYAAQQPAPVPVLTVTARGHIVQCVRCMTVGHGEGVWAITAMHNAWDDSSQLGRFVHFTAVYEASPMLFDSIGGQNLNVGNVIDFSGVVKNYWARGRVWVVEHNLMVSCSDKQHGHRTACMKRPFTGCIPCWPVGSAGINSLKVPG
ncbi:uncharacterized protein MELLADRAFT_111185 [Melampsora larici-populina 98AG31]|uniref:Uncharacterized protein n=1 Tax=Melampsora larici-populina (strain 98AG31 / pathotype 3-4-7) TaxID=747676 RepID=F4S2A9_MELLP|nr:uncharacterized protein MELLADRAFT_111185 [Melampsora larici-populina 98AG31]EGG01236.1 hypothetical protein MELLADRAFT_111185 [Melampsora larici-populina 98AG31]